MLARQALCRLSQAPSPTLFLADPLSCCVSPTGLAENVHCDLHPVDPKRGEVTYTTSQVAEGCVAHVPNAVLEVHVLFLEFPNVSSPGRGQMGSRGSSRAMR